MIKLLRKAIRWIFAGKALPLGEAVELESLHKNARAFWVTAKTPDEASSHGDVPRLGDKHPLGEGVVTKINTVRVGLDIYSVAVWYGEEGEQ